MLRSVAFTAVIWFWADIVQRYSWLVHALSSHVLASCSVSIALSVELQWFSAFTPYPPFFQKIFFHSAIWLECERCLKGAWCRGLVAWLLVGQASHVLRLSPWDVAAVAAPRLCSHLPSTSNLSINEYFSPNCQLQHKDGWNHNFFKN